VSPFESRTIVFINPLPNDHPMSMAASGAETSAGLPLADRIVAIVSLRGNVGITRDELLRRLGVAYDELMAALDQLRAQRLVRVHWPSPESFRVFYSG